jgi:exopolysaccharide biosynthesis polyprenyl glycosylphosphotransferase
MLRRSRIMRTRVYQVMDAGLFMLAFWLAHLVRDRFGWWREPIAPFNDFMWLWMIVAPASLLALAGMGFYDRPLRFSIRQTAWISLKASVVTTMVVILAIFFSREMLARGVFVLFGFLGFALVLAKEVLLGSLYQTGFAQGQLQKRVILLGDTQAMSGLRVRLAKLAPGNLEIVATLTLDQDAIDQLPQLLHQHSANGVVLHAPHIGFALVEKAVQICELEGVETWLVADFFRTLTFRTTLDDFYGIPMVVFRSAPESSWQALAKQMLDYAGALVGVMVLLPLLLLLGVLIRLGSRGPVLFRQERCGLHGKPFTMLKFRTMVSDAEQRQQELLALNEMSGPVFKVTNDPRITPIGRFLRKYSLDELPQLFNVLSGDMSLVGPRPLPVSEVQRFDDLAHRRRLSVKPGLTCLWQVSGRNNVSDFKEWVRLDLEYIDHWSIWLDLKILLRTVPVVLMGSGAK